MPFSGFESKLISIAEDYKNNGMVIGNHIYSIDSKTKLNQQFKSECQVQG